MAVLKNFKANYFYKIVAISMLVPEVSIAELLNANGPIVVVVVIILN